MAEIAYKLGVSKSGVCVFVVVSCPSKQYEEINTLTLNDLRNSLHHIDMPILNLPPDATFHEESIALEQCLPKRVEKERYFRTDIPFEAFTIPRTETPAASTQTFVEAVESVLDNVNAKWREEFKLTKIAQIRNPKSFYCAFSFFNKDIQRDDCYSWYAYFDHPTLNFDLIAALFGEGYGHNRSALKANTIKSAKDFCKTAAKEMVFQTMNIFNLFYSRKLSIIQKFLGIKWNRDEQTYTDVPVIRGFEEADQVARECLSVIKDLLDFQRAKQEFVREYEKRDPVQFERFRVAKMNLLAYQSIAGKEFFNMKCNSACHLTESEDIKKYQEYCHVLVSLIEFLSASTTTMSGVDAFCEARTQYIHDSSCRKPDLFEKFRRQAFELTPDKHEQIAKYGEFYYQERYRKSNKVFYRIDCLDVRNYTRQQFDETYLKKTRELKIKVLEMFHEYVNVARNIFEDYLIGMEPIFTENINSGTPVGWNVDGTAGLMLEI